MKLHPPTLLEFLSDRTRRIPACDVRTSRPAPIPSVHRALKQRDGQPHTTMNPPPNQYEIENAKRTIYGYFTPQPDETAEAAFRRAKAEAVHNLTRNLEVIESIPFHPSIVPTATPAFFDWPR